MSTTSIHSMNADQFLRKKHAPMRRRLWIWRYYLMNYLNNLFPDAKVDPNLKRDVFRVSDIRAEVDALNIPKASPSRMLSNLFWKHLDWQALEAAVGTLCISDFGCGDGHYGALFQEFSGDRLQQYHGYDLFPNDRWQTWQQDNAYMSFQPFNSSTQAMVGVVDEQTNLIVSQSAIEHFNGDLQFFKHIQEFVQSRQKPTIQIHLFPSAVCLPLYRLHGIRQYTPRTVSKITRLFSDFSTCILYDLGNKPSNDHHMETITRPYFDQGTDYRETHTDDYYQRTLTALEADMHQPSIQPAFYALIMHSYPEHPINYLTF